MTATVYQPKGKAKEYCDLALNIYYGCPHKCSYCYVPNATFRQREEFHAKVKPSPYKIKAGIGVVLLCFTSDPYPNGIDHSHTANAVQDLSIAGYRPALLTKNPQGALEQLDLLLSCDAIVGTTISCWDDLAKIHESGAPAPSKRMEALKALNAAGVKTWVSVEPVLDTTIVRRLVETSAYVDIWKFGKLNHVKNATDWKAYADEIENIILANCKRWLIKDDLWAQKKDWRIAKNNGDDFGNL